MSKVFTNKNVTHKNIGVFLMKSLLLLFMMVASIIFMVQYNSLLTPYFFIPVVLFGFPSYYFYMEYKKLNKRKRLEKKLLTDIENLPEEYHVVSNVYIPFQGKIFLADSVIIGPNGIFVITIRDHDGTICESDDPSFWVKLNSNQFRKTKMKTKITNPIKSTSVKVLALSKFLKKRELRVWVESVIYFSNSKVKLTLFSKPKNVFADRDEIIKYITEFPAKRILDKTTQIKILKLILMDNKYANEDESEKEEKQKAKA